MNQAKNSGTIRMALILNVLLVLSIGAAIYYLVNQLNQPSTQVDSSPVTSPAPVAPALVAPATPSAEPAQAEPVLSEEEIAQLEQRLEQEQSKLTILREEEELVEKLLQDAQSSEANTGQAPPTGGLITPMGFPERPPEQ